MEKANIGLLEGPSTLEKHIQITDKHSFMQLRTFRVLKDAVVSDTPCAVIGHLNTQHCYRLVLWIVWML